MSLPRRRAPLWSAQRDEGPALGWGRAMLLGLVLEAVLLAAVLGVDWTPPPTAPREEASIKVTMEVPPPPPPPPKKVLLPPPPPPPPKRVPPKLQASLQPTLQATRAQAPTAPQAAAVTPQAEAAPLPLAPSPAPESATAKGPTLPSAVGPQAAGQAGGARGPLKVGHYACSHKPEPIYPRKALQDQVMRGEVVARVTLGADGHAKAVTLVSADPPGYFEREVRRVTMQYVCDATGEDYTIEVPFGFHVEE